MNRLIVCFALVGSVSTAAAAPELKETVVHDTSKSIALQLTDETVLCSSADYGALFLKVLIPQLASMTLLDHQNLGAGAPCVAAGMCQPGRMPEDILDPSEPSETVDVRVKAIRVDEIDREKQTCTTSLTERVDVTIRGFDFAHERYASLGERPISDCGIAPDDKADQAGPPVKQEAAGCAATGGASGGMFVLAMLGVTIVRRRRRS